MPAWQKRPSVPFDRAVGYYDRTRQLSPESTARLTAVLAEALIGHGPVLEIGVGTGRIALPLADAGLDVVGIDLSRPMLDELRSKGDAVPVAEADCTALPFPDDSFGAVIAAHVFHLVPEWRDASLEVLRVLRPDGVFLWARGGHGAPGHDVAEVFAKAAGVERTPVGLDEVEGLDAYLRSRHWKVEWLEEVPDDREITTAAFIDLLESGQFAWTWRASEEDRARGAEAARAWAVEQGRDLEAPVPMARPVRFRRYVPLRR
ncbi:MAG TPA: class I SAM-dependent methyltransferase [Acidimicrobiales bacterium]|nr:class I SAM-dependent methyltransferase [Acidimicrobiales bacterium]